MTTKGQPGSKTGFRALGELKTLTAHHFETLDKAASDPNRKVAWCTSVGPVEILRALDFEIHFPENHAAMIGAKRLAGDCITAAGAEGFSQEICSYLTSDVGAALREITPLTKAFGVNGLPRPDVLVYGTNQCREVQEWFNWWGRRFDVPVFGFTPPRAITGLHTEILADVEGQLRRLAADLERAFSCRLDEEAFSEAISQSAACSQLWGEVLETARHFPSPLTFFDAVIHMAPAVLRRGAPDAPAYYRLLLEELQERVRDGVAAVAGETHRIYWEGMPVWGRLRAMSDLFAGRGAAVVASTYAGSWVFPALDPDDPFASMARALTELFVVRDEAYKETFLRRQAESFGVGGMIFLQSRTCPANSNAAFGMPLRIRKETGLPVLVLEGDPNDLRFFDDNQSKIRIEAFLEEL